MTTGRRVRGGVEVLLLASYLTAFRPGAAPAQGAAGSNTNWPVVPREVVLRPEVVPYELERADWRPEEPKGRFVKEPELSPRHVFRRVLQFGKDTNNAFGLIWDEPRHKLYLDLNRNGDLTDDPAGAFTSTSKGTPNLFRNVTLPFKTAAGSRPATLDLRLFADDSAAWMQVQLTSHRLWQAKVTLEGEEWQVTVMDKLLGSDGPDAGKFLLLRPWAVRTNRVFLDALAWGTVPFPDQLFWAGKPFHLERRFELEGGTGICKLTLAPQQPPLAELRLSGDFLCYAVLQATNGYTLVLPGPARAWRVPQGIYAVRTVWLKQGTKEANRRDYKALSVHATTATSLVLGGPLTNSVELERYGRRLLIGHQVLGADGAEYRLVQQEWEKRPEFAVYRGGKKVFSDRFQPG